LRPYSAKRTAHLGQDLAVELRVLDTVSVDDDLLDADMNDDAGGTRPHVVQHRVGYRLGDSSLPFAYPAAPAESEEVSAQLREHPLWPAVLGGTGEPEPSSGRVSPKGYVRAAELRFARTWARPARSSPLKPARGLRGSQNRPRPYSRLYSHSAVIEGPPASTS